MRYKGSVYTQNSGCSQVDSVGLVFVLVFVSSSSPFKPFFFSFRSKILVFLVLVSSEL